MDDEDLPDAAYGFAAVWIVISYAAALVQGVIQGIG